MCRVNLLVPNITAPYISLLANRSSTNRKDNANEGEKNDSAVAGGEGDEEEATAEGGEEKEEGGEGDEEGEEEEERWASFNFSMNRDARFRSLDQKMSR